MGRRELDIVVFGATGFTGGLTAEYLARAAPAELRIGLAGRDRAKLAAVAARIGGRAREWPILIADTTDAESPAALADRTKVVISTVGPFAEYGLPLVAACAAAGTDYCDLTGEPQFVRRSADGFHKQAADTGARIVHSCGFDSVPSDLSVHALHKRAHADGAGELTDTTLVVRKLRGGASGGTIASIIGIVGELAADPTLVPVLTDPYALSPARAREPELGAERDGVMMRGRTIDASVPGWTATFPMAPYNTRVVRRSNAIRDWAYGRNFRYREVMTLPLGPLAPAAAALVALGTTASIALLPALRFVPSAAVDLLRRRVPLRPGTGPSAAARARGHFTIETFAATAGGRRYGVRFAMTGDPGYAATAVMLSESGIALALGEGVSEFGGVLTPAVALGSALIARLRAAGATIEFIPADGAAR